MLRFWTLYHNFVVFLASWITMIFPSLNSFNYVDLTTHNVESDQTMCMFSNNHSYVHLHHLKNDLPRCQLTCGFDWLLYETPTNYRQHNLPGFFLLGTGIGHENTSRIYSLFSFSKDAIVLLCPMNINWWPCCPGMWHLYPPNKWRHQRPSGLDPKVTKFQASCHQGSCSLPGEVQQRLCLYAACEQQDDMAINYKQYLMEAL